MEPQTKTLFDERAADAAVIGSLINHIKSLEEKLRMAHIVKTVDGKYYRLTEDSEELSEQQVTDLIATKQAELTALEAIAPSNNATSSGDGSASANGSAPAPDAGTTGTQPTADASQTPPAADPAAANGAAPAVDPSAGQAAPVAPAAGETQNMQ